MRGAPMLAGWVAGFAISTAALAQPRPSNAEPGDFIGPSFTLPIPSGSRPSGDANTTSPSSNGPAESPAYSYPISPTPQYAPRMGSGSSWPPVHGAAAEPVAPVMEAPGVVRTEPTTMVMPAPLPPRESQPQISSNAEAWRYRWSDGRWWHFQPSGQWLYWSGDRWVEYSASRYSATSAMARPPVSERRWIFGRRPAPAPQPGMGQPGMMQPGMLQPGSPDAPAAGEPSPYAPTYQGASGGMQTR